jgi:hypothetical protein
MADAATLPAGLFAIVLVVIPNLLLLRHLNGRGTGARPGMYRADLMTEKQDSPAWNVRTPRQYSGTGSGRSNVPLQGRRDTPAFLAGRSPVAGYHGRSPGYAVYQTGAGIRAHEGLFPEDYEIPNTDAAGLLVLHHE